MKKKWGPIPALLHSRKRLCCKSSLFIWSSRTDDGWELCHHRAEMGGRVSTREPHSTTPNLRSHPAGIIREIDPLPWKSQRTSKLAEHEKLATSSQVSIARKIQLTYKHNHHPSLSHVDFCCASQGVAEFITLVNTTLIKREYNFLALLSTRWLIYSFRPMDWWH